MADLWDGCPLLDWWQEGQPAYRKWSVLIYWQAVVICVCCAPYVATTFIMTCCRRTQYGLIFCYQLTVVFLEPVLKCTQVCVLINDVTQVIDTRARLEAWALTTQYKTNNPFDSNASHVWTEHTSLVCVKQLHCKLSEWAAFEMAVEGLITLRDKFSSAVYCDWSCVWFCVCVCLCVCGSVTTITRNCLHRSSPNWVCWWR